MSDFPSIVLVRPQIGENIGASARAMLNFGLDRMRIVAPRDGWPNTSAVAMASGAGRVLDAATVHDTVSDALRDTTFTFATTARTRELTKPVFSPEAAMTLAAQKIASGGHVAVMFGPEAAGLENADIALANAIISVPVNPDFASLNLAQCVLLLGYEWRRAAHDITATETQMAGTDWANGEEVEALAQHYEDRLQEAHFFFPEHKANSMKVNLRNLWSRMPLTSADARMFHGILRQLVRGRKDG